MPSAIYQILNTANGKCYVGSAVNLQNRLGTHRSQLRAKKHGNRHLQAAWNKYGESAFEFRVILICAKRDLLMYEQRAIDAINPQYNICRVAGSGLGVKWTPEARARKSAEQRAKPNFLGRKHSPETLAKMSAAHMGNTRTRGKQRPPDAVARTAAAHRGMKRSPETCAKIAAKAVGRVRSAEAIEKGAAKRRGVRLSPEHAAKLIGNKHAAGSVHTAEADARRAAAVRAAWAARKAAGIPWKGSRAT